MPASWWSPVQLVLITFSDNNNWYFMLPAVFLVGFQLKLLTSKFLDLSRDTKIITEQVYSEYNTGFVYPNLFKKTRDFAVMVGTPSLNPLDTPLLSLPSTPKDLPMHRNNATAYSFDSDKSIEPSSASKQNYSKNYRTPYVKPTNGSKKVPNPRPNANCVFLTIDLTQQTLDEAISNDSVGFIVAYHPPIFSAWKSLVMSDYKKSLILKAAVAGISIYSPHTALDSCKLGINAWICSILGPGQSYPISPIDTTGLVDQDGAGEGRILVLDTPTTLSALISRTKLALNLPHIRVARAPPHHPTAESLPSHLVSKIAICAGSGYSVIKAVPDAHVYFTGEMGHHDMLAATSANTSCILAEHSNSERGFLPLLKHFPSILIHNDTFIGRHCNPTNIGGEFASHNVYFILSIPLSQTANFTISVL
ncbi:Protein NIF3-like protein [Smittium mucronatum]|uniref:Protein NIF3-like protein n=1 Tax=Smittium mucronatum TaxID=133383 RepID=A0A1R0H439_9FUNG|nr:Protein NIF3-like protein [Smittium mucronatum]